MSGITKWLLFILLACALFGERAQANTIAAATCNQADVANAVAQAQNGDTVTIPPGNCAWSTTLSITTGITLLGAGAGNTVITDNTAKGNSNCAGVQSLISVSLASNVFVRISGFTVVGVPAQFKCGESANHIHIDGVSHQARVDHITFNPLGVTGVETTSDTWGVVDHITFIQDAANEVFSILVQHNSWQGVGAYGDNSYAQPDTMGQAGAVYIEDNTWSYPSGANILTCIDSEAGGRLVFRHNSGCPSIQVHGMDSSGRLRSARQWEVYNNTFTDIPQPLGNEFTGFLIRGGTGMIFSNDYEDSSQPYVTLAQPTSFRDTDQYAPWAGPTPQNGSTAWGVNGCDGNSPYDTNAGGGTVSTTFASGTASASSSLDNLVPNGSPGWSTNQWVAYSIRNVTQDWGSTIVSNAAGSVTSRAQVNGQGGNTHNWASGDSFLILRAYPCLDQFGRGAGQLLTNADPVLSSTGIAGPVNQASDPAYQWLNTHNGGTNYWSGFSPQTPEHIQANRDYYDFTTNFNGASGMGSGPIASRPATCTTGVGWWATDQGSWNTTLPANSSGLFYRCTATNTWTQTYTPFTYPHPLINGAGNPPAAPMGLAASVVP